MSRQIQTKRQLTDTALLGMARLFPQCQDLEIPIQRTRKEYEGDYTLVLFGPAKSARLAPLAMAQALGPWMAEHLPIIHSFNVVQGFLNIRLSDTYWLGCLQGLQDGSLDRVHLTAKPAKVMVEYSSPNTNKPLHLGHVRNNFLGHALARLLQARGHEVIKANLVNDRGIHICKSMLAWQRYGNGETPLTSGMKGDHLVGKYYVAFDKAYKTEIAELVAQGMAPEQAKKEAPIMQEAQEMLRNWESGQPGVRALWYDMNQWVYAGFEQTYARLGVDFDVMYYESDTYLLGKDLVEEGLEKGVFERDDHGAVWCDLTADGLDRKIVQRADGTSVYITQDLGTAELKYRQHGIDRSVYVVGDEQDYHFKVLIAIMKKLGRPYAHGIFHLSYGMIELPTGRMKSREGTVVDADDLMDEMERVAEAHTRALGKTEGLGTAELSTLYAQLAMGALRYYLLKVEPKKKMVFNPEESIDFQGNTGPFIQYNHARICSMQRKLAHHGTQGQVRLGNTTLLDHERELCRMVCDYGDVLAEAEAAYSPALVANYCYELAKAFSSYYAETHIAKEEDPDKRLMRLVLVHQIKLTLQHACGILGMALPEQM
ncbi:MAG: arginine--tRNA ligase [Bacteroidetes bacterium]|nr:arginine--tRNA ligase [Bacteroidota bacterium]